MPSALLVHHNTDDRAMYADYLTANGIHVAGAATTDEAFPMVANVNVVITGRLIPGAFDAVELIRRIKAAHPTKPVIAVTACGAGAMRDAANRAGCLG